MKLVMIKIIFEVLLVPNKRVFRIQVNYVMYKYSTLHGSLCDISAPCLLPLLHSPLVAISLAS